MVSPAPDACAMPAALLDALRDGVAYLTPVYAAGDPASPIDFACGPLNQTARRLLGLPEEVAGPRLAGVAQLEELLDFCRTMFGREEAAYSCVFADGQGGRWRVVAQRQAGQLVVVLTEMPGLAAGWPLPAEVGRYLLAQTSALICLLRGPEHHCNYMSAAAQRLFAQYQLLGRTVAEALPGALAQPLQQLLDKVYATGEPDAGPAAELVGTMLREQPPHYQHLRFSCQAYHEAGRIVGVALLATDMSAQILLSEELRTTTQALETRVAAGMAEAQAARAEAERLHLRLERVFQQLPAAVAVLTGPDLRYELVNPPCQALSPGQDLRGMPLAELLKYDDNQAAISLVKQVYATGVTCHRREIQLLLSGASGVPTNHYFDILYQARYDEHGTVDGVLVFAFEITEQVLARQQVQRLNEELAECLRVARADADAQRQQLAAIIEHAPVAISYLEGPNLRLMACNPIAHKLWASSSVEMLGQPLLEVLPHLAYTGLDELLHQVLRTQQPLQHNEVELMATRDGQEQPSTGYFDIVCQPLLAEQGKSLGVLVVAIEVTAQVLARQQAQRLTQELTALVAAGVAEAQAARTESEWVRKRLERFFAQAPAAICVLDGPELVFELVNPGYQALFPGRPMVGLPLLDAMPEFRSQPMWPQMQEVYATGKTHEERCQLISLAQYAGGPLTDFYFHYVQQARYDEQGRVDGVLVFALDITAQVRVQQRAEMLQEEVLAEAHRRLQEREALYRIFAQTPAMVAFVRGPELRYEYANEACERQFQGRQLQGLPLAEVRPTAMVALVQQVYDTGEPCTGTEVPLPLTLPGGQRIEGYTNFTYQAYRENGVIRGVAMFAYDVTEQVRARQQRDAGLAQMQTVFEHAAVALALLTGPSYVIEVANPAMCELWACERCAILGRPLFDAMPELLNTRRVGLLEEVRRSGVAYVEEEQRVRLWRDGRHQLTYFHFVCQPLKDAQGLVTAVMLVATDISSRVLARQQVAQANEELRAANAQLTRTNTDLDNFIYTASHDLKSPIANVESLLLLLRKQLPPEACRAGLVPRVLDMMQASIERFQLTIVQLTDLSRLQQAHAEPYEAVSMLAVVEAIRLDLAPELEASEAQLLTEVTDSPIPTLAPQQLRSVVYNLLSNAIKYRHPTRLPVVQLRCHTDAGGSRLTVQDNGLGLSEPQQRKLFGLYQRLHAHVEGSGVGLYLVKRIVENAGGTITVQSQPGVGSTFIVTLPTG